LQIGPRVTTGGARLSVDVEVLMSSDVEVAPDNAAAAPVYPQEALAS
jgi:hypothetical protein